MGRARGQLASEVMEALWNAPMGLSARELTEAVPGVPPALTTMLTVLQRLADKGLVIRHGTRGPGYWFTAASTREEDVVNTMVASLTSTMDRQATLVRFIGELDEDDAATLQAALHQKAPASRRRAGAEKRGRTGP
ncbi:MAG: BlaI/MecI/CopY family transcriptional regulator [Propionibacteriales bacterium]|nr:BlaI/MecI/CopY family transcriptional regulator [Propionibacteriales bacterium]